MTEQSRVVYLDNLRLFIIILVVLVHSAVTYSGIGDWYYKESGKLSLMAKLSFTFFQSFTQSYFMGFLFLLAGYMVPRSLEKRGIAGFLRERWTRLGLPTLFYMLLVNPFIIYCLLDIIKQPFADYIWLYYIDLKFVRGSGPLWFALALLIFSVLYALSRGFLSQSSANRTNPYTAKDLTQIAVLIAVFSFIVRLVQPIDTNILNMQLCFFSQYVVLFTVGIIASRGRLLEMVSYRFGLRCLQAALIPGVILWFAMLIIGGALSTGNVAVFKGGFYWQSLAYAMWESFNGVLMSFGLLGVFKEKLNTQNAFIKAMSASSFAVFVFHAPILVAISKTMQTWAVNPSIKFFAASISTLVVSFGLAHWILTKISIFSTIKRNFYT